MSRFGETNVLARRTMAIWIADVERAEWKSHADIKKIYPRSREIPGRIVVFPFITPPFTITTQIAYSSGVVVVLAVTAH